MLAMKLSHMLGNEVVGGCAKRAPFVAGTL
jgi:hypothetical protein